jgi:hypothetical protein
MAVMVEMVVILEVVAAMAAMGEIADLEMVDRGAKVVMVALVVEMEATAEIVSDLNV